MELFIPERHQVLCEARWSEEAARSLIRDILQSTTLSASQDLSVYRKTLYDGYAGYFWGLRHLGFTLDSSDLEAIYKACVERPDDSRYPSSYFVGEAGVLALLYCVEANQEREERLAKLIEEANQQNDDFELFCGSAGTNLLSLLLWRHTKKGRFLSLYLAGVRQLLSASIFAPERNCWYWPSSTGFYIGACHGLFGCFASLLAGLELLSSAQQEEVLHKTTQSALSLASRDREGRVNWRGTLAGPGYDLFLVQWCHGVPGIISALARVPVGYNKNFDQLLLQAGELCFAAGPSEKGANLCHGTSGNGYAFLALYQRTKDPSWLQRARAFAMHAATQRNNSLSLWTGDLGLACFLYDCIRVSAEMPMFALT